MSGGFGSKTAIPPLDALPEPMKAEALRMLLDMGMSPAGACRHVGLTGDDFSCLLRARLPLWRVGQRPDEEE